MKLTIDRSQVGRDDEAGVVNDTEVHVLGRVTAITCHNSCGNYSYLVNTGANLHEFAEVQFDRLSNGFAAQDSSGRIFITTDGLSGILSRYLRQVTTPIDG